MEAQNTFGQNGPITIKSAAMPEAWAVIVLDRWVQALQKYKIGVTGALMKSFEKEIKKANGNVDAVIFKFLNYGRFDDMGVGRGTDLNGRVLNRKFDRYRDASGHMQGTLARKKKPWYTKNFYREVAKLRGLYQQEYGEQLLQIMESRLSGTINLQP
jgi:hypothetical protein